MYEMDIQAHEPVSQESDFLPLDFLKCEFSSSLADHFTEKISVKMLFQFRTLAYSHLAVDFSSMSLK